MEQEVRIFKLDNQNDYLVTHEKVINGVKYYCLVNVKNSEDICFRKEIIKDGERYLSQLESEQELMFLIKSFNLE